MYKVLIWSALLATIMPITDGILAFDAQAPINVILKHAATVFYLLITAFVLKLVVSNSVRIEKIER